MVILQTVFGHNLAAFWLGASFAYSVHDFGRFCGRATEFDQVGHKNRLICGRETEFDQVGHKNGPIHGRYNVQTKGRC